jgi:hypothetical protein
MHSANAGFEPNQMQAAYTDNVLIVKFVDLIRDLRRFPVDAEVVMKARSEDGFPVPDTFRRAFGSKQQFAAKLLDYCKARSGYDDVIALCPAIATVAQGDADKDEIEPEEVTGFVYLMKSGRHYKDWPEQCGGPPRIRACDPNAGKAHHCAHHPHR